MVGKACIGIDFGTQSGRAVVVELGTSRELAQAVCEYRHGVMDQALPDGQPLAPDWALQHPDDYIEVLRVAVPRALADSGLNKEDIIGVGIDFTACTMLPIDAAGLPLCVDPRYRGQPHAYVKLWKHHAAQGEANRLNEIARDRGEAFLPRYGGKISSEWMIPKIWQILNEAPEIYRAADRFVEAADWVVARMTGNLLRNSCTAGYKAVWHKRDGYPSPGFFAALDPRMADLVATKLRGDVVPLGTRAGGLSDRMAAAMGLLPGTAVAVANVDAHVTVPAVGLTRPGAMLMIMGTSTCHMLLADEEKYVPGMCGVVEDGILPGLYGYEAGQSCVGDHFEWFVENCMPEAYALEARALGIGPHQLLEQKASRLRPGQSGLIALDWWNGNRSVLVDADLTGLLIGQTLLTKPEEIYRALIEATAYGTRMIIESFRESGVAVDELYAAGGIAEKNAMAMQIYADVTGMPIKIAHSAQAPAVGAAMFAAVAAGVAAGGYDTIFDAARQMGRTRPQAVEPDAEAARIYDELFAEYRLLHDCFGRGANDVMKRLRRHRVT